MKLNNKGVSLVEMIVSIGLISIVLVLLMEMFVNVRASYINSETDNEYEIIKSEFLKAIYNDIDEYTLESVSNSSGNIYFTYLIDDNDVRKILSYDADSYTLSYKYETTTTNEERIDNIARKLPEDVVSSNVTLTINEFSLLSELKIRIINKVGNNYDINIWYSVN